MTRRTLKIGSAGRYSSRYGRRIRKSVADIEEVQRDTHECPSCKKEALERESFGVWKCGSCEEKLAGGAFKPTVQRAQIRAQIEEAMEEDEEEVDE